MGTLGHRRYADWEVYKPSYDFELPQREFKPVFNDTMTITSKLLMYSVYYVLLRYNDASYHNNSYYSYYIKITLDEYYVTKKHWGLNLLAVHFTSGQCILYILLKCDTEPFTRWSQDNRCCKFPCCTMMLYNGIHIG